MTKKKRRCLKKPWTTAEDRILRRRYPHESTAAIAKDLGRSLASVYAHAYLVLRLRKTAAYLASPEACRLRRDCSCGLPFRFQKGHVPANKGLRRPGWGPGRMKATQFRKGQMPHNWQPIGTEVVDRDGYRKRKVADDRTQPQRFNWQYVHVLVWEAAHGPVPDGHKVVFVNGHRADLRLENLACVSDAEMMRRNSYHNYPQPIPKAIQLLGALTRQIRRRDRAAHEGKKAS